MKRILLLSVLLITAFVFCSCMSNVSVLEEGCDARCEEIAGICSEVITSEECKDRCDGCDTDILDEIKDEQDCGKIDEKLSACVMTIQEDNTCDAACKNYNNQCLTLVPNANQELFDEGYESCMQECENWDSEKRECMASAQDCPSMTEVCGL